MGRQQEIFLDVSRYNLEGGKLEEILRGLPSVSKG